MLINCVWAIWGHFYRSSLSIAQTGGVLPVSGLDGLGLHIDFMWSVLNWSVKMFSGTYYGSNPMISVLSWSLYMCFCLHHHYFVLLMIINTVDEWKKSHDWNKRTGPCAVCFVCSQEQEMLTCQLSSVMCFKSRKGCLFDLCGELKKILVGLWGVTENEMRATLFDLSEKLYDLSGLVTVSQSIVHFHWCF